MSLYNLRNPAVKRLMKEAEELRRATDEYHAQPLDDNLFEWHFSIRGPPNSDFEGGIYHGRITLPPDYPMKPPSIILLTPNGRFEINKKICLSISGYHPESWQPSWSIRTALLAIIGFMPTHGNGALGSLDYTPAERKELALKSQEFKCPECGYIKDIFSKHKLSKGSSDTAADDSSDTMKEINETPVESPGRTCIENASEKDDSDKKFYNSDEGHLLTHRHITPKSTVISNETSHIENVSDTTEKRAVTIEATCNNQHNLLYLAIVSFILSLLLVLIIRRVLSM